MSPELSRRLGRALGGGPPVPLRERLIIIAAAERVDTWEQLPADIQARVIRLEQRGA